MGFKEYFYSLTAGEKKDLIRKLDTSYMYLLHLIKGRKKAGAKYLSRIEEATNGFVTPQMLRPDLFKPPTAQSHAQK